MRQKLSFQKGGLSATSKIDGVIFLAGRPHFDPKLPEHGAEMYHSFAEVFSVNLYILVRSQETVHGSLLSVTSIDHGISSKH